jgi:hypothetical protein
MSHIPTPISQEQHDQLMDLLIQKATTGLSDSEQQELDHLESPTNNRNELEHFELAAAAFDLSFSSDREEMPQELHDRLLVSAGKFFGGLTHSGFTAKSPVRTQPKVELANSRPRQISSPNWREIIAVLVTAASLLLLLSGFNPFEKNDAAQPSAVAKLDDFVRSNPHDLVKLPWTSVHDADASGEVLWSDEKQEGYMVFEGLDINDPNIEQYQLWIFDTDRKQKYPVDGGVFDIKQADIRDNVKVVIPIHPHIPVDRAVQFAVTVERHGGVTVSEREKIPVLATVEDDE